VHTAIVLGAGFSLLLTCLLLGHAFGGGMPGALAGAKLFIPLWRIGRKRPSKSVICPFRSICALS
jgi:hypothetical protein